MDPSTHLQTHQALEDLSDLLAVVTDPVERLLLTGQAASVHEAEELYLDAAYSDALALLEGPLSDEELGDHPLFVLYRSHGSRPREDSVL
jgi:hypothetical protein